MLARLLIVASGVILIESFFSAVLTPLVPAYREDLGLTEGATGILVASYSIGGFLLAFPAGWFASRFNPRNAVVVGLLGVGVSSALFGFAGQVEVLDASRFFLGAFGALLWAGGMSWIISAAPLGRRGEFMGILMAAAVVGELVGSPIGALADDVGTEYVFGAMLLVALVLIFLARTVPPVAEASGQTAGEAIKRIRSGGIGRFGVALMAVAAPGIAVGLVMVLIPVRFEDLGISAWYLAAVFLGVSIVEATVGPVIGRVSDRVGRKRPYLVGLVGIIVATVLVGLFESLGAILPAMLLFAVGAGFAFTTSFAVVTDLATRVGLNQGYSAAVTNVGWAGSIIIGAVGGGALLGAGGFSLAALVLAALMAAIALVSWRAVYPEPVTDDGSVATA